MSIVFERYKQLGKLQRSVQKEDDSDFFILIHNWLLLETLIIQHKIFGY